MPFATHRNYWIDNLRAVITILVLAHHAALAYTTFSYFDTAVYINSTHPVVDASRWIVLDVLVSFNDIFFMPLMFLISGLFLFSGIQKKGKTVFLLDRLKRLGLPFLIAEIFIIPLAYIPSYYLVHHRFDFGSFISDYLALQQWPVGPPWFIWLLLAFTAAAALLPRQLYMYAGSWLTKLAKRPLLFFFTLLFIAAIALIPLSIRIGQYTWTGYGPFDFQLNRVLFYFIFFLLGAVFGAIAWQDILFAKDRLLGKQTGYWILLSGCFFGIVEYITYEGYGQLASRQVPASVSAFIFLVFFIATCLSTCFAFLAFFRSRVNNTSTTWKSLSANAYGIYLLHYVFITWLQYALLPMHIPVAIKFCIVFLCTVAASWYATHLLRKNRMVAGVV